LENEQLRVAITRMGLSLEEFADIVQVDVRTVRRWLAGRTPYPRHRAAVANALDTTERVLWPDAVAPPAEPLETEREPPTTVVLTDGIAGYPQAKGSDAPSVRELLSFATSRVELILASNGDVQGLNRLLRATEATGLPVRVIIGAPVHGVEPILGFETVEIRVSAVDEENILLRVDDRMLLVLISMRSGRDESPVIYLRRCVDGGLFDRLADDFDAKWLQAAPLSSLEQLAVAFAETELQRGADRVQDDILLDDEPARPAELPRRWPRRRT
jgi:transcriptional regulator with XRE-family HTH domain